MAEIDEALRGLRTELHAALPVPDVGHMAARARHRRRLQVAVIAAVIAVAVAVPVLRSLPRVVPPAAPPAPRPARAIDFADERHGYALTESCTPKCTIALYATEDGGRTWSRRALPPADRPKAGLFNATMHVVDARHLVIDQPGYPWVRHLSDDGGRTWQLLDPLYTNEPAAPPLDWPVSHLCGVEGCALATIQQDGLYRVVRDGPALEQAQTGMAPTAGGKYWAVGRAVGNGPWTIAVSADRGRTWSSTVLDLGDRVPAADGWAVVERNGIMYATSSGGGDLIGVWRSTDDGRSWDRTWSSGAQIPGLVGSPVVTADGVLLVSDGTRTFRSTDLGHTFTRDNDTAPGQFTWTRAGYLRANGGEYALSTDGRHWRSFVVR